MRNPSHYSRIKMKDNRPSFEEYFMQITHTVAQRSSCLRRKVGAIAVRDAQILSTGYNGVPRNVEHCISTGCLRQKLNIPSGQRHEICRGLHAEQNVIVQAATHGIALKGATLYCTTQPCLICTKMLINVGIQEIIYSEPYNDELAEQMLNEAKIPFKSINFQPLKIT